MNYKVYTFDVSPYLEAKQRPEFVLPVKGGSRYFTHSSDSMDAANHEVALTKANSQALRIQVSKVTTEPLDADQDMESQVFAVGLQHGIDFLQSVPRLGHKVATLHIVLGTPAHALPDAAEVRQLQFYCGLALEVLK